MNARPDTRSIALEYQLPHPPTRVWRALAEPALLARWILPNDIRADVGHRFTFRSEPTPGWDGIVRCEVLAVEPDERLSYSWRSASRQGDSRQGGSPAPVDTVVTWTLAPTATGGTRLGLVHGGFLLTDRGAFEGAWKGWQAMLGERLQRTLAEL